MRRDRAPFIHAAGQTGARTPQREAVARGDRHIGVEHVLLGLLDPKSNMTVELVRYAA
jgi:ClpA/ClpB-like protein